MVCHKKSFSSLLENNSFSSAVLSSRAIAEGVLQLRYTASKLECMPSSVSERLKESILKPVDIVIDMFDASCIFYQDVAGIVVALGNAVLHQFPKRNREILVGKLLPQGAVGIGQHLGCLYGNNAVQTDALLIHLVQYGQCHMEFEYTEQGEVYMVIIPEHVSFVCPYGYTNGGFLAIGRLSIRFLSSDICCARTTVYK